MHGEEAARNGRSTTSVTKSVCELIVSQFLYLVQPPHSNTSPASPLHTQRPPLSSSPTHVLKPSLHHPSPLPIHLPNLTRTSLNRPPVPHLTPLQTGRMYSTKPNNSAIHLYIDQECHGGDTRYGMFRPSGHGHLNGINQKASSRAHMISKPIVLPSVYIESSHRPIHHGTYYILAK